MFCAWWWGKAEMEGGWKEEEGRRFQQDREEVETDDVAFQESGSRLYPGWYDEERHY